MFLEENSLSTEPCFHTEKSEQNIARSVSGSWKCGRFLCTDQRAWHSPSPADYGEMTENTEAPASLNLRKERPSRKMSVSHPAWQKRANKEAPARGTGGYDHSRVH